jgi:Disulphide bond corrector protein DsbC
MIATQLLKSNQIRCACLLVVAFAFAAAASAQELPNAAPLSGGASLGQKDQFVRFVPPASIAVASGRPHRITLRFEVVPGHHINSNKPHSELLIPTKLRLNPPTDVLVGKVEYPKGKDLSFAFAPDEKLSVYSGPFAINALVTADRTATPGRYRVHGELAYQACNDRACFPPKHLPVSFDVRVQRARNSGRRNPGQSPHIHQ